MQYVRFYDNDSEGCALFPNESSLKSHLLLSSLVFRLIYERKRGSAVPCWRNTLTFNKRVFGVLPSRTILSRCSDGSTCLDLGCQSFRLLSWVREKTKLFFSFCQFFIAIRSRPWYTEFVHSPALQPIACRHREASDQGASFVFFLG